MALTVKSSVRFEIKDGLQVIFQSGQRENSDATLTEYFGGKFDLPAGSVDTQIPMFGVTNGKRLFLIATQDIRIKVVVNGFSASTTPPLSIPANAPFIIATQDVVGLFVSNTGSESAIVVLAGAGDDSGDLPPLVTVGGTAGQFQYVHHVVTSGEALAKSFALAVAPSDPDRIASGFTGMGLQGLKRGRDYDLSGITFSWAGRDLDGLLEEGDELWFYYFS